MKEISALDLRKKFGEVMDAVRYDKEPWLVKKNGRPAIVLVEVETFRASQSGRSDDAFIEIYSDERMKEFMAEDQREATAIKAARKSLSL